MKTGNRFALFAMVALMTAMGNLPADAAKTWDGSAGEWTDGAKWGGTAPGAGEDAIINAGSVLLTADTDELGSLTMGGGTLTMSNWTTRLRATTVTLNSGATITIPSAFTNNMMSNRVWIVCTNITIAAGAKIDVDGKGWAGKQAGNPSAAGYGPGAPISGSYNGAAYGGYGRQDNPMSNKGLIYGSITEPTEPGSGGSGYAGATYYGGNGGGAVLIVATSNITVNGSITANGGNPYDNGGGGGSGGGIYIACNTISGSGMIRANGTTYSGNSKSGGGGRIAVTYDSAAQAAIAVPTIVYSCNSPAGNLSGAGDIGTLYFTDNRFLERNPLTGITGQWYSASANINFAQLTISNAWIRFATDGVSLTVTNEFLLTTNARVEIGGNAVYSNFWWDYKASASLGGRLPRPMTEMTSNPRLECGSITLTNGGALWVFAGLTNGTFKTGAVVKVAQTLTISTNSWLYPVNHGTNGGHVVMELGGMKLLPGGGIDANGLGFGLPDNTLVTVKGYGYGGGWYNDSKGVGGGHGGAGGNTQSTYGRAYGSSNTPPFYCGSGGGAWSGNGVGGSGGGLVQIDATLNDLTIDGAIKADGGPAGNGQCGAGAGGGVYIVCQGLAGSGLIQAEGGTRASGLTLVGGGGGGRIAIFRRPEKDTFTGSGVYSVNPGYGIAFTGEVGTIYLGESILPVFQGTFFMFE